jgi:hypothetical protein
VCATSLAHPGRDVLFRIRAKDPVNSKIQILSRSIEDLMSTQFYMLNTLSTSFGLRTNPRSTAAGAEKHPVSYSQEVLFYASEGAQGNQVRNTALCCVIHGRLNTMFLRAVFDRLVKRHSTLRTRYWTDGSVVLQAAVHDASCDFESIDASKWTGDALHERIAEDMREPFDLRTGDVFRVRLYSVGEHKHRILMCAHQIAADVRSLLVLLDELRVAYTAGSEGTQQLPALEHTYIEHACRERRMIMDETEHASVDFWRGELSGDTPRLALSMDRPQITDQLGGQFGEQAFRMPKDLMRQLEGLAEQEGVSLSSVYLTAYAILLSRYGNSTQVRVASSATTRSSQELNDVGDFLTSRSFEPLVNRTWATGTCSTRFRTLSQWSSNTNTFRFRCSCGLWA